MNLHFLGKACAVLSSLALLGWFVNYRVTGNLLPGSRTFFSSSKSTRILEDLRVVETDVTPGMEVGSRTILPGSKSSAAFVTAPPGSVGIDVPNDSPTAGLLAVPSGTSGLQFKSPADANHTAVFSSSKSAGVVRASDTDHTIVLSGSKSLTFSANPPESQPKPKSPADANHTVVLSGSKSSTIGVTVISGGTLQMNAERLKPESASTTPAGLINTGTATLTLSGSKSGPIFLDSKPSKPASTPATPPAATPAGTPKPNATPRPDVPMLPGSKALPMILDRQKPQVTSQTNAPAHATPNPGKP